MHNFKRSLLTYIKEGEIMNEEYEQLEFDFDDEIEEYEQLEFDF